MVGGEQVQKCQGAGTGVAAVHFDCHSHNTPLMGGGSSASGKILAQIMLPSRGLWKKKED